VFSRNVDKGEIGDWLSRIVLGNMAGKAPPSVMDSAISMSAMATALGARISRGGTVK